MKSLAFSLLRTVLDDPGATSQSDLPRSLPIQSDPLERHTKVARDLSPGDTKNRPWNDLPERHLQVAPRYFAAENHDFLKDLFAIYFGRFALGKTYVLNIFCSHQTDYLLIY